MFYYSCFIDDKAGALRCFFIPLLVTDGLTINHLRQILDHQSSVAFSRRDLLGQKKKMCWWRLSQIFHSQACWPYVQCACPWSPQSQGQPTTPSLTSSVSPFPQLFPLNLTNMLKSPTTQSLSFFSPLPHSQVATVYRQGGLGFAAVTIKYSMFCSNKSCFSFMLDVHQGHLWLCSL